MKGELSMRALLLAVSAAFVLAAPAAAGGWATAGLGPPDSGIGAGDTWNAKVTILQHGQTPLVGVSPVVKISKDGEMHEFPAAPTGQDGVYLAKVEFPSEGSWTYQVDDGFGQTHSFAPVQIGAGSADGGFSIPDWTWLIAAAVAGLLVLFVIARRLRPSAAPVGQP
jgi:YtkA-like